MTKTATLIDPTDPFDEDVSEVDPQLVGAEARFQLLFVGAPLRALLAGKLKVGTASLIYQTETPLPFRYVDVLTLPTDPLLIREAHHELFTRPGAVTTVVEVEMGPVPHRGLARFIDKGQSTAEASLATAVTLLDERIADRRIAGQVWITTDGGGLALIDVTRGIRYFEPALEVEQPPASILSQVTNVDLGANEQVAAALECYLAALEMRVSPAGFVLLAGALDTLCPGKKNTLNLKDLEAELRAVGVIRERADLVRVVKVRGNLVHQGFRQHPELREAWYTTEELVRLMLRKRLGLQAGWPARVPMSEGASYRIDQVYDTAKGPSAAAPAHPTVKQLLRENPIGRSDGWC